MLLCSAQVHLFRGNVQLGGRCCSILDHHLAAGKQASLCCFLERSGNLASSPSREKGLKQLSRTVQSICLPCLLHPGSVSSFWDRERPVPPSAVQKGGWGEGVGAALVLNCAHWVTWNSSGLMTFGDLCFLFLISFQAKQVTVKPELSCPSRDRPCNIVQKRNK